MKKTLRLQICFRGEHLENWREEIETVARRCPESSSPFPPFSNPQMPRGRTLPNLLTPRGRYEPPTSPNKATTVATATDPSSSPFCAFIVIDRHRRIRIPQINKRIIYHLASLPSNQSDSTNQYLRWIRRLLPWR